ncbi:HNH endonuclease [Microbacterium sp. VKM Ac-2870]|uniref:HNH endonuclease signature motif containing protein n=1 Tax=Microbacterium sp. VKM Ac-2870 TaxID=2783825 RepID=UPI00188A8851|nr:HNH endonuclease signature motif containing protein [Microbacterium sp. VKM Ac-2870]MBF4563201.1 HNH endonuclease [Microbacterium sp. VKM Ac-2870]
MSTFTDLRAAIDTLQTLVGDVDAAEIPASVASLSDAAVVSLIACASALVRGGESLRIAGAGVVASRSTREHGHGGLAQTRGHRSPLSFIQELTGATRADAAKHVRLGETLTAARPDASGGDGSSPDETGASGREQDCAPRPWHAALADALLAGTLTSAQHDAILRGLGQPRRVGPEFEGDAQDADTACGPDAETAAIAAAWAAAACRLRDEAPHRTVEELAQAARTIRDLLDPAGAERRFDERFQARSFRMWTDHDGLRRGSFTFDDEAAAWVSSIIDAALRPRRGGPRFVDEAERALADELVAGPRTNDQLCYDLMIDVLRAGTLADADAVFGTRQAGVRLVITADAASAADDERPAVGVIEDGHAALPAWLVAQHACDTGGVPCTLDTGGGPLDVGRESRLFTPRQRIALAIRDGGCRWHGCDRPPSYCEAHHIDQWQRDEGRTDLDRGILLCRFHHMQLHHGGWRVTRDGRSDFELHPPDGGPPTPLRPRLALRYAWGDLRPPPRRLLPAA